MKEKSRAEQLAEKREFWKKQIQSWQESGLNQAEYCRNHDLISHRFTYWKNKLVKPEKSPISLVQVNMKASPLHPLRLVFGDPYYVEIDRDFDPVVLRQLLYTVKNL